MSAAPPNVAPSPNVCLPDSGSLGWCGDGGPATRAKLAAPMDVVAGIDGSLVVADTANQVVRRIAPDGTISTIAGFGVRGHATRRVPARRARFRGPSGVAIDADGSVLVVDRGNGALRRIDTRGFVTIVAARLAQPSDVAVLPDGSYAVSEPGRDRVVRVTARGAVTRLAGTGARGYAGDGAAAVSARLNRPTALASSEAGLLIADTGNGAVRRVGLDGTISTVAGVPPGRPGTAPPALQLALSSPRGVAAAADDGFVLGDRGRIWAVAHDGAVRPVAGTDTPGFNGDRALALSTQLATHVRLATGPGGAILVADTANDRIRSVTPAGVMATVAGSDSPDVSFAPVARTPLLAPREPPVGGPASLPITSGGASAGYRKQRGAARAQRRRLPCSKVSARLNILRLLPYSEIPLRARRRPVVLRFGTSVDIRLTGYAWRAGTTFGRAHRLVKAGRRKLRLRGGLDRGTYFAVIIGRSRDGMRGCDARRLRVA